MIKTYRITGMTCQGCVASVKEKLAKVEGVEHVAVHLEKERVEIEATTEITLSNLKAALPKKYDIQHPANFDGGISGLEHTSKWAQLRPLFLIFIYLFAAAFLLNVRNWDTGQAMLDFMGLFYIVFSFFKVLDLKGFPASFRMYDPLAKAIPVYGWMYPFVELGLGLMFLMRFQIAIALIATIIVLGLTTFGVAQTLLKKRSIRCACLGTALQLPMTEATIIENTIMLVMAISMLLYFM